MKGLSVMQPWASLIAFEQKPIENRTWIPSPGLIGARVAIHASKKLDLDGFASLIDGECDYDRKQFPYPKPRDFPTGAIVCTAVLVAVVRGEPEGLIDPVYPAELPEDCRRWFFGPVGLVFRSVRRLAVPVPCKGALGFWLLPVGLEDLVNLTRAA